MYSIKQSTIGALGALALTVSGFGQTILMDYDDGDAGNGVHDDNINNGDIGVQDWTGNHQYSTNNNSGVGSNQNLIMGSNRVTSRSLATLGYSVEVGHTLDASFMWRAASGWDAADRPVFSIFYTDDDTISGNRTELFSYEVPTSNSATYRVETVPSHRIIDTGAVGKTLFVQLTDNASAGGNEFIRVDNFFVSVDTTVPSPFLIVEPTVELTANTTGTSSHTISLSNLAGDGTTALNISGVVASGPNGTGVSNISFPASVAAGGSDDLTFDFSPSAGPGNYSFDLQVSSDDAGFVSPRVISVTLEAIANPLLTVEANPSFTNNGASENFSVSVSNDAPDATTPLLISGVSATGDDAIYVSNVQFPASVAAGASDDVTFDFLPTDGGGDYSFNLEITSDDESEVSPRVVVVTISVEDPVISVATNAFDFGNFATAPAPQTSLVTISNTGGATDLVVDELSTAIVGAAEFTVTSFPGPIAPGGSGDLEVTFTPATAEGLLEGTLTIVSNDFDNTQPQVELRAFIFPTEPVAAIDFGTVGSPVATDYEQFIAAEGASQTVGGVNVAISSRDANISSGSGASSDDLFTDYAQTPFNGGGGNYISVVLSGLSDGTLNLVSSHDYTSSFGLPLNIQFGELGGALVPVESGVSRPAEVAYSAVVEAGKTYELRVLENGNANLAYISGLLLWGDAVPGGAPTGSFLAWADGTFINGTLTDKTPTGDDDSDTLSNLLEFAFGTDPTVSDAGSLTFTPGDPATFTAGSPTVSQSLPGGGDVDFKARYVRRLNAGDPGSVEYALRFSSDLTDWESSSADPSPEWVADLNPISLADDGTYELIEVDYPWFLDNGKKARFFQVEVTEVPNP